MDLRPKAEYPDYVKKILERLMFFLPPGCPKSPQFRARSAFCATLEGVEAPEGAFFGQAPPPVDCREISRPRAIHPGRAAGSGISLDGVPCLDVPDLPTPRQGMPITDICGGVTLPG